MGVFRSSDARMGIQLVGKWRARRVPVLLDGRREVFKSTGQEAAVTLEIVQTSPGLLDSGSCEVFKEPF